MKAGDLLLYKKGKLVHDSTRCTYCGLCAKRCPHKALKVNKEKRKWKKPLICMRCGRCVRECPEQAIRIVKEC